MWCVADLDDRCIDKTDVRPPLPAKPAKALRRDKEYKRCGTANMFGVPAPQTLR
jgi:hypothetical protein